VKGRGKARDDSCEKAGTKTRDMSKAGVGRDHLQGHQLEGKRWGKKFSGGKKKKKKKRKKDRNLVRARFQFLKACGAIERSKFYWKEAPRPKKKHTSRHFI